MLQVGREYRNPRNGAVGRVLESTEERAAVERELPPNTGKGDAHVHHDFHQRFEVVEGTASLSVDGDERTLGAGESIEIERGVPHVDFHNASDDRLVVRNIVTPAPRFVHVYFASWGRALEEGRLNDQDEFTFVGLLTTLNEANGDSWAAGPPVALQKLLLGPVAAIGRRRGQRTYAG
jgi:mannose-6-phosphate isomerase-like protein (cupin superfamily)